MEGSISVCSKDLSKQINMTNEMNAFFKDCECKCFKYVPKEDQTSIIGTIEIIHGESYDITLESTLELALKKAQQWNCCFDGRLYFHDTNRDLDSVAFFEFSRSSDKLRVVSVKEKLIQLEKEMDMMKKELFFATMQNSSYQLFVSNLRCSVTNMTQNEETVEKLRITSKKQKTIE